MQGLTIASTISALALISCQPALDGDKAFGEKVHAYLVAHPEVLAEASAKLHANEDAASAAAQRKAEAALPRYRAAIERDPRDFVANPEGKITVTEFYDYRCPHCANMAPKIVALIRTHPDIRFVFKEMPIFGAASEHAAYAALAVKKAGGDYLALYETYMSARPLDDATIENVAKAKGARAVDIAPGPASTTHLANTSSLFNDLALDGTPGFVVGNHILAGEDMAALETAIDSARKQDAKN